MKICLSIILATVSISLLSSCYTDTRQLSQSDQCKMLRREMAMQANNSQYRSEVANDKRTQLREKYNHLKCDQV